jgi:hypothetical protein
MIKHTTLAKSFGFAVIALAIAILSTGTGVSSSSAGPEQPVDHVSVPSDVNNSSSSLVEIRRNHPKSLSTFFRKKSIILACLNVGQACSQDSDCCPTFTCACWGAGCPGGGNTCGTN